MKVRNNRMSRDNKVVSCSEVLDKPPPLALGFSHRSNRREEGLEFCNLLLWVLYLEGPLYLRDID